MFLIIENKTNKLMEIAYDEKSLFIEPYAMERIEINKPQDIIFNSKRNNKSFTQRFKEEYSINGIDLNHLRFNVKYSSYLKTIVNIYQSKSMKQKIVINEDLYIKNNIIELRCFEIMPDLKNVNVDFKCVDKQHKLALILCCIISLFLKYGIIGIVGLLFCFVLFLDFNDVQNEGAGAIICYLIAAKIFICYFVMFVVKLFQTFKILKDI